jgi:hypothetical protein
MDPNKIEASLACKQKQHTVISIQWRTEQQGDVRQPPYLTPAERPLSSER